MTFQFEFFCFAYINDFFADIYVSILDLFGLVYLVWEESPPAQSLEDLFSEIELLKELPKSALED